MQKENLGFQPPSCESHEYPPTLQHWMNTDHGALCVFCLSQTRTQAHTHGQTHLEPHPQRPVWERSTGPLAEPPPLLHASTWSISVLFNNFRIKSHFSAMGWVAGGGG